jgi:hypothetical protein
MYHMVLINTHIKSDSSFEENCMTDEEAMQHGNGMHISMCMYIYVCVFLIDVTN